MIIEFISDNIGNILVVIGLGMICIGVIAGMIKKHKAGKSFCGCDLDCSKCNKCRWNSKI